jgi:hypothetical protein
MVVYSYAYADLKVNIQHLEQGIQKEQVVTSYMKEKQLEAARQELNIAKENFQKAENRIALESQLRNEAGTSPSQADILQKDSIVQGYLHEANIHYAEASRYYEKATALENFKEKEKELELS